MRKKMVQQSLPLEFSDLEPTKQEDIKSRSVMLLSMIYAHRYPLCSEEVFLPSDTYCINMDTDSRNGPQKLKQNSCVHTNHKIP